MVRPATLDDAEAIAYIRVSSWRTTYRGLMPDAVLDGLSVARRADFWQQVIGRAKKQFVFAVEGEGRVASFGNGGPEQEANPHYTAELYALYLLPGHQGRGYGKALFNTAVKTFVERGHTAMLLWVLSTNPSRDFYETMGGTYLKTKPFEIGGETLEEVAYSWDDLPSLVR